MKPLQVVHAAEAITSDETLSSSQLVTSDETHSSSQLIIRKRVGAQHPRWLGGFWFGTFGCLAALIWFACISPILVLPMMHYLGAWFVALVGIGIAGVGAFTGFGAGSIFAPRLLKSADVTPRLAGRRGAEIAVASNFGIGLIYGVLVCATQLFRGGESSWFSLFGPVIALTYAVLAGAFCLVVTGLITVPMGYLAGRLLYRYSYRQPRGCRVHGYRQLGESP